jgi:hypothetical protein
VIGAVFAVVLDLFQFAPVVGLAVSLFAMGYFGSYYLSIVGTTMTDGDTLPDWPSFTDFSDDILHPFLRLAGLLLLSFGPVLACVFLVEESARHYWPLMAGALLWGCVYFPMAVVASSAFGSVVAALPHIVLPAIVRSLPAYAGAVVALVLVFILSAAGQELATRIPYAGWLIAAAVWLYSLMFQARLIGLIYRFNQKRLGWE